MHEQVVHSKCEDDVCFQFSGSLMLFTVEKGGEGGMQRKGGEQVARERAGVRFREGSTCSQSSCQGLYALHSPARLRE